MRNAPILLTLVLLFLLSVSCVTSVRYASLQVLMPAEAELSGGIAGSVAVVLPDTLSIVSLHGLAPLPGLLQPDTFLQALGLVLQERLRESPRYANAIITLFRGSNPGDGASYDMIVRVDSIRIGHEVVRLQDQWGFLLQLGMYYSGKVTVLEPSSGSASSGYSPVQVADRFTLKDSLFWKAENTTVEEALKQLPQGKDIFWDLGFTMAGKVAARYSPMWQTERRVMLLNRPATFLAYDYLQAGNPEEALKVLSSLLSSSGNLSRDASTHLNLSVVYEYMDQLQQASQAAEKARALNPGSSLYRKQADALQIRAQTREKLIKQME